LKALDRKIQEAETQIQALHEKAYLQEQVIYEFRKDLAQTMNESEKF